MRFFYVVSMLAVVALVLVFFMAPAANADPDAGAYVPPPPAAAAPATTSSTTTSATASSGLGCRQYVGVSNRIASCIRAALGNATEAYFNPDTGIYPIVAQAITALITLAVIVYGIMLAAGMVEKLGRDTIMLLIKIAFISYFVTHVDLMYNTLLTVMDDTAEKVVEFVPQAGSAGGNVDFAQITCIQNMKQAQIDQATDESGLNVSGPWMGMDCLLDTIIGIKGIATGSISATSATDWTNKNFDDSKSGLSRGMLGVFFSSMETSVMGLLLGAIGFIFIYGLVQLIIKALFVYISGYLGVAFIMILAPIFIPLALFQITKQYFDKWVKLLVGFTLQPIIILVFISFNIAAVDLAAFSGNFSIMYRLAGEASRQKGFNLNQYLQDTGAMIPKPMTVAEIKADQEDPASLGKSKEQGVLKGAASSDCIEALTRLDKKLKEKCDQSYAVKVIKNGLDWEKLAQARKPPVSVANGATKPAQQIANEVLAAAIFCGIVVFIMNGLFRVVPALAQDLLGDFRQSPNLFATGGNIPGMDGISSLSKGIQDRVSSMASGRGGT